MKFKKLTEKEVYALPCDQFVYLTDTKHFDLDGKVPPTLITLSRKPAITGIPIIPGDSMMFVTSSAIKISLDGYMGVYGKDWFVEIQR